MHPMQFVGVEHLSNHHTHRNDVIIDGDIFFGFLGIAGPVGMVEVARPELILVSPGVK